jgi:hypothetical protein
MRDLKEKLQKATTRISFLEDELQQANLAFSEFQSLMEINRRRNLQ